MFAEDVGLLPQEMFTGCCARRGAAPAPSRSSRASCSARCAPGGRVGFESVHWFNGDLFNDDAALPHGREELETRARRRRPRLVGDRPSILGTLFERGLDPDKRSQLGAHYTDRDKIMLIVDPVIVRGRGLRSGRRRGSGSRPRWSGRTGPGHGRRGHGTARRRSGSCARSWSGCGASRCSTRPAGRETSSTSRCTRSRTLEHRVQLEAEAMGLQRSFPAVGPANMRGIELNAYAAELARVSVWIGEIQWMRRNGFQESRDPILNAAGDDRVPGRDPDRRRGGARVAGGGRGNRQPAVPGLLAHARYPRRPLHRWIRKAYQGHLPAFADLVCYWLHKAGVLVARGAVMRAGLVATNSIRGGRNRSVLDRIAESTRIFDAWADEPWIVDGAAVRVSLVCFGDSGQPGRLNGAPAQRINADLTAMGTDLTRAGKLARNRGCAFVGGMKKGSFDIPGETARQWLAAPGNPNGRTNADVLKPWRNGKDLTQGSADKWIVDFGHTMGEMEAALYEAPFGHVEARVKPQRQQNRRDDLRTYWWRHDRSGQTMFARLETLPRYIATPRVAKHRLFVWLDAGICPDSQLIVIARDDDTIFGILHSRFHEAWSLRLGTWLGKGNDPRYTPTTTFETFPSPTGCRPTSPPPTSRETPAPPPSRRRRGGWSSCESAG